MSKTIAQIKADTATNISSKTAMHSISPANVGGQLDELADALEQPLSLDVSDRSVTTDNTERDVWTFDIPANTFGSDGDEVEVRLLYQTDHTVSSVIRLYLDGTKILEQDTSGDEGSVDNVYTEITLRIYRLDASNLRYTVFWANDPTNTSVQPTGFFGSKLAAVNFAGLLHLRLSFQDISIGIAQKLNLTKVVFHRAQ